MTEQARCRYCEEPLTITCCPQRMLEGALKAGIDWATQDATLIHGKWVGNGRQR